jgi:hypothetical protein
VIVKAMAQRNATLKHAQRNATQRDLGSEKKPSLQGDAPS